MILTYYLIWHLICMMPWETLSKRKTMKTRPVFLPALMRARG